MDRSFRNALILSVCLHALLALIWLGGHPGQSTSSQGPHGLRLGIHLSQTLHAADRVAKQQGDQGEQQHTKPDPTNKASTTNAPSEQPKQHSEHRQSLIPIAAPRPAQKPKPKPSQSPNPSQRPPKTPKNPRQNRPFQRHQNPHQQNLPPSHPITNQQALAPALAHSTSTPAPPSPTSTWSHKTQITASKSTSAPKTPSYVPT